VVLRGYRSRLQPGHHLLSSALKGRFFLFILLILVTSGFARLDRDKANNIPRIPGGAFGSAWLTLQLQGAALAVRLLSVPSTKPAVAFLFSYLFLNPHFPLWYFL
jgi:hypothetical protein